MDKASKQINVIIAEDNKQYARLLKDIVTSLEYNVIGVFHNKLDTLNGLKRLHPDIVLLDMKMDTKFTGAEIGEFISRSLNIPFIYITSYSEKKIVEKALKTKPKGYFLKPFNRKEIGIGIELAINAHRATLKEKYFSFNSTNANLKIPESDILFLKSDNNYVEIHTIKQKYLIRSTLKSVGEKLSSNVFLQIHRSYIVNVNFVLKYKSNNIYIENEIIPVSRKYHENVKKQFL